MAIERSRAGALALAVSLHLAVLGGVLAPRYERVAPVVASGSAPPLLTVRLLAERASAAPAALPPSPPLERPAPPPPTVPVPAAAPDTPPPEFEAPTLAAGMEGMQVLLVPELDTGYVPVRLWIGADGAVEKVELGPHRYQEADAERVRQALLQVRFHPARRHGSAVPAELALDLRVVGNFDA
ncbi:hypothetical protein ABT364_27880 [Massilia sp. SR12]